MKLYRITPEAYIENYSGLGASYQDGARWNRPGQPVLYFALDAATALLELGQYLPSPQLMPKHYRFAEYDIPDDTPLQIVSMDDLPYDWAAFPYPRSTQQMGGDWIESGHELGLVVPSCAVPQGKGKSLVVNARHRDCNNIQLLSSTSDIYNPRLFSSV